jgi:hypothetical protein
LVQRGNVEYEYEHEHDDEHVFHVDDLLDEMRCRKRLLLVQRHDDRRLRR